MVCSNLMKIHWIFYILENVYVQSFAQDNFCTSMYISDNGFHCSYCPAGSYKEGPCAEENGSSICRSCPTYHFEPSCNNASRCQPCRDCKKSGFVVKQPCNAQKDTVCICPEGKYFLTETNVEGICLDHTICKPGEVVRIKGTPWQDTVCVKTSTESSKSIETSTHQTNAAFQHTTSGHQIDTSSQKTEDGTCSCDDHTVGSAFGGFVGGIVVGVLVTISMCWLCRQKNWCWFSKGRGRNARGAGNDIDSQGNPLLSRGTSTTNRNDRMRGSSPNAGTKSEVTTPNANGSDRAQASMGIEAMVGNSSSSALPEQNASDRALAYLENEAMTGNSSYSANGSDRAQASLGNEAMVGNNSSSANGSNRAQASMGNEAMVGNNSSSADGSDRAQDSLGNEAMTGNSSSSVHPEQIGSNRAQAPLGQEAMDGNNSSSANGSDRAQDSLGNEAMAGNSSSSAA